MATGEDQPQAVIRDGGLHLVRLVLPVEFGERDNARFHRTTYMASRQQERGWEQFLRSAAKCGAPTVATNHFRHVA